MKNLMSILLVLVPFIACSQHNKEQQEVEVLLREFLANVQQAAMHDRFWAEDLVYTSSSGKRHGKQVIMAGFGSAASKTDANAPSYDAEDINIRIMGEFALLDFTLVSKLNGEVTNRYLNSGTLIKREGLWKVINWQATPKAGE